MSAPSTAAEVLERLTKLAALPAAGQKRFQVTIVEWRSRSIVLDAPDAASAENVANLLRSELGMGAFRITDIGTDGFIEEIEANRRCSKYVADAAADRAQNALLEFTVNTGTDWTDSLCDLLADLMHLCDRDSHLDFECALELARGHYAEETRDVTQ